ncbi:MAG: hypothetical protein QM492_05970 [Rhodobacterales bacterium]
MTLKTIAATTALVAIGSGAAVAGGLDRVTFSSSILYEQGTYAEVGYGLTTPKISNAGLATGFGIGTVATSFNTVKLGFKTDITDKIAVALMYNNQPVGADINYGVLGIAGTVDAQKVTALAKYQFTKNVSAYGGVVYQYISGSVRIPPSLALPTGIGVIVHGKSEYGYIAGAAYEIPDIKLRVALSYESKIKYALPSTVTPAPLPTTGTTTAGTPEAWTLEFQSGVAPKTLVFGSIRYAKHGDTQITLPIVGTITSFTNVTTYELGVAHKFNKSLVLYTSIGYEKPDNTIQSLFAPTDGQVDLSFGGQLDLNQGYKVAMGMTISRRGDATTSLGTFNDNTVMTAGIKLSKNF